MPIVPAITIKNYEGQTSYDLFSLLLKERIIIISGEITDQLSEIITAELLYLEAEDQESPITIYINSPGGSVTAGMAVYDIMKSLKVEVKTIAFGLAASMGAFLLSSGTKGQRYAYKHTEIMIHQPLGQTQGQVTDLKIMTERCLKIKETVNKILSDDTGKDYQTIVNDTERDNFFTAMEAKKYGLIDHIL